MPCDNEPANALEQLHSLIAPAKEGDATAIAQIRELLDCNPCLSQQIGDLGGHVERAWLGLIAKHSPHVLEAIEGNLAAMRDELAGDTASPLERLLVAQVVSSWLQVRVFEIVAASHGASATSPRRQTASIHRRLDQAQRRHLAAIKSLAETRRLLGDGRQIHVVGPWVGEP